MNLHFLDAFSKNTQKSNFTKIRQWEPQPICPCGRTDGRTERHDKANSRFWHYCACPWKRASKNSVFYSVKCSWGNNLLFRGYIAMCVQKS